MAIPVILFYLIFHYLPMGCLLIAFQEFNVANVFRQRNKDLLCLPYMMLVMKCVE